MLGSQGFQRDHRVRERFLVLVIACDESACPGGADTRPRVARLVGSLRVHRGDPLGVFTAPGAHVRLDEVRRPLGHAALEAVGCLTGIASREREEAEGRLHVRRRGFGAGDVADLGDALQAFRAASAQCIQSCEESERLRARPFLLGISGKLKRFRARGVGVQPPSRCELEAREVQERERKRAERSAVAGDRDRVAD